MFSGIIEDLGQILNIENNSGGNEIFIKSNLSGDAVIGDSICVNGVCLTVSHIIDDTLSFSVINETLNKTNLSDLKSNAFVNLESSLKYNGKISGHLIQGHVESVGEIINIENIGTEEVRYSIKLEKDLLKYCIYKGSISIDGISLTIANILGDIIEVAIIPYTLKHTNLSFKKINDRVNIETDMISKYVENIVGFPKESK